MINFTKPTVKGKDDGWRHTDERRWTNKPLTMASVFKCGYDSEGAEHAFKYKGAHELGEEVNDWTFCEVMVGPPKSRLFVVACFDREAQLRGFLTEVF